jgi:hypothetical protein
MLLGILATLFASLISLIRAALQWHGMLLLSLEQGLRALAVGALAWGIHRSRPRTRSSLVAVLPAALAAADLTALIAWRGGSGVFIWWSELIRQILGVVAWLGVAVVAVVAMRRSRRGWSLTLVVAALLAISGLDELALVVRVLDLDWTLWTALGARALAAALLRRSLHGRAWAPANSIDASTKAAAEAS